MHSTRKTLRAPGRARPALVSLGSEVCQETMKFDLSECYSAYGRQNREWLHGEYADSFTSSMGNDTFDRINVNTYGPLCNTCVLDQGAGGEDDEEGLGGIAENIRLRGTLGTSVSVTMVRLHMTHVIYRASCHEGGTEMLSLMFELENKSAIRLHERSVCFPG